MLFWIASPMLPSISGTCLWAAAWKTTSGRNCWKSCRIRAWSVMLAMQVCSVGGRAQACELAFDLEDAVFAAAHQHQRLRIESQHLPADLRADAAPGAGDHHRAAFQQLADHLGVQLHRGAAEQVADFDVADGNAMVAAEAVFQAADDLQVQARLLADRSSASAAASRPGCRRSPGRRLPCTAAAISRTSSSLPSTGIWPSRDLAVSSVPRKPRMR